MWWRRIKLAFVIISTAVALGVSILAWHSRSSVDLWHITTPSTWVFATVSPASICLGVRPMARHLDLTGTIWRIGRYAAAHEMLPPGREALLLRKHVKDASFCQVWHGFGWLRVSDVHEAWAPTWLVLSMFISPLALLTARHIRRRRSIKSGHCPCGYDLRATPERCPECGLAPTTNATQAASTAGGSKSR